MEKLTEEEKRLQENVSIDVPPWYKWGPYISERSWGTVREDYSPNGDPWNYLNHTMSRSKAYRWGEDGLAGLCDRYQILCFAFAFWNGRDPFLKERLFGLNTWEGNHGEDVKEAYYHLDNTPTHSYMKYLYKYPHAEFPYQKLVEENHRRNLNELEYELYDTGVFDQNRYFDIFIEYAKITPEDIAIRLEIINRGPDPAELDVLPHLWFRNMWGGNQTYIKPIITQHNGPEEATTLLADDSHCDPIALLNFPYNLGKRYFYGEKGAEVLFTENETHEELFSGGQSVTPYVKDAFHRYVCQGEACLKPDGSGTKSALRYQRLVIPGGASRVLRFRLTDRTIAKPLADIDEWIKRRKEEADAFYQKIAPPHATEEERLIERQAFAGLLWSKQIYLLDVNKWLHGDDPANPPAKSRRWIRNVHWRHLLSKRVLSMPDKWEYPWFAAWDLAFHCIPYALIDIAFAKEQLWLLLFDQFQHPNGQIPAYEWEFSDLNPPVQAWAAWRLYKMEEKKSGKGDLSFLKKCFNKLVLNFVWWVNRVDASGNNVFEGGFLGLDNITVFDRSAAIPGGGTLEQSDGTGWMGMFCLMLMRIAIELSKKDHDYEVMATKFFEHYVYIAAAMEASENRKVQLWNEDEGFFYDVLSYPDGRQEQILVHSLVGIIPFYALDFLDEDELKNTPEFNLNFQWFLKNRSDLTDRCITKVERGGKTRYLLGLTKFQNLKRVVERICDPEEFRAPFGLRSLSRYHEKHPFELFGNRVEYEPGESRARLKGGNSNWRGPIWFPTSFLLIDSLKRLAEFFGDTEKVEVAPGQMMTFHEVAEHFSKALISLFKRDEKGHLPIYDEYQHLQDDPLFNQYLLFYEHYHPETGRGLGASHQTGWTALIANLIDEWCG